MDRLFYLTASAMLALLLFTVAPAAAQGLDDDLRAMMRSAGRTVTVSGKGTARAAPDEATVRFGVVTEAETPEAAREQNAEAAANALNTARELVPAENVRLETLRLQPRYEHDEDNDERRLVGYEAVRAAVVEVSDLAVLPQLVARVVEQGANRLDGIDYGLADRAPVRREALQEAASDARDKAEVLAQSLEVSVGGVVQISEQGYESPRPRRTYDMAAAGAVQVESTPDAYAAGQIEVSATVEVTFTLE